MDGWTDIQNREESVYSVCVCVCVCGRTYARLLCRDRWLIECRAKWVSVYACEQRWGAGGAALTLELSQQMEDGKGHRLWGMRWLLEDESSATRFFFLLGIFVLGCSFLMKVRVAMCHRRPNKEAERERWGMFRLQKTVGVQWQGVCGWQRRICIVPALFVLFCMCLTCCLTKLETVKIINRSWPLNKLKNYVWGFASK